MPSSKVPDLIGLISVHELKVGRENRNNILKQAIGISKLILTSYRRGTFSLGLLTNERVFIRHLWSTVGTSNAR
jgi:hypothetical protein